MVRKLVTPLSLQKAEMIIDTALARGASDSLLPLTVVVLDIGGHLIAMKRQDGCGIVRTEIATAKAWGALGMGLPSKTIAERLSGNPAFLNSVIAASGGRLAAGAGGVLVLNDQDEIIGAVGISGDTGDNDEISAIAGVVAAGCGSAP